MNEDTATDLVAAFEHRLRHRDDPPVIRMDPASIQARLLTALHQRLARRDARRLRVMVQLCYNFLTLPRQLTVSPELCRQVSRTPGSLADAWRDLEQTGLIIRDHAGRQRVATLTHTGEEWLLAVAKGETPQNND